MCAADLCDVLRCAVYAHVLTTGRGDLESTELQPAAASPPPEPPHAVQPARPRHLQRYSQARVLAAADRGQCARCVSRPEDAPGDVVAVGQCAGRRRADNASLTRADTWWWGAYAWWWLSDVTPASDSDDVTAECEEEREEEDFEDPACDPETMERLRETCEVRRDAALLCLSRALVLTLICSSNLTTVSLCPVSTSTAHCSPAYCDVFRCTGILIDGGVCCL